MASSSILSCSLCKEISFKKPSKEQVKFLDVEFARMFKERYKGFLTKKEIKAVTEQDKELWFNDKQVRKRWSRMKKLSA